VPPGTPRFGLEWKRAVARHYNHTIEIQQHGTSAASRPNYLDLDLTYKDAWGQPLLRMTFDFPENDIRMSQYIADKAVAVYQSTHNAGGAVMGTHPATSAVNRYLNRYLQCWDVPNLFSPGAASFRQNITYNYSVTIGALLGARCDQEQVPEIAGTVGASMTMRRGRGHDGFQTHHLQAKSSSLPSGRGHSCWSSSDVSGMGRHLHRSRSAGRARPAPRVDPAFPQKAQMILQRTRPPLLETPWDVFDRGVFTPNDRFFVRWHWAVIP
jgi:GMC oxidoreductase